MSSHPNRHISVLLRGTLCPFSQIFSKKFWWFPKLYLSLQPCRIVGNAEVRPMNVTQSQRHEVERNPNGLLHLFFVPLVHLRFRPLSNQNSCSYETTTANPSVNISRMISKCSQPCRSFKRKKTSVMT